MRYEARVVPGRGEGRKLGFPTMNLELPPGFAEAYAHGVYAGLAWPDGPDAGPRKAAIHYGPVPTFRVASPTLEVHVLDADIPQAPPTLAFELVKRLRDIEDFQGPDALAAQIAKDIEAARKV